MKVYVHNMITKSKNADEHVRHLGETFAHLKEYKMKINLEKCIFGVSLGKFLGFMVSHRAAEANLEKMKDVIEMKSPYTLKEIQRVDSS